MSECWMETHRLPAVHRCAHLGDAFIDEFDAFNQQPTAQTAAYFGCIGEVSRFFPTWEEAEAWLLSLAPTEEAGRA